MGKREQHPRQIPCFITHTNEQTHDVIRSNLDRSPMYAGVIEGIGPRYCPSIEDKVVKFKERTSHQIFLEPQGYDTCEIYPNGLSTSLPLKAQIAFLRTIRGLENVAIIRPGYAIEYDFFDPRDLKYSLETKAIEGLFFAGQINGTTNVAGAAHRITAADAGSLVYASGATMTTGVSFTGNPFGTTSLNSVVFQNGSLYQHVAGSNPFGATAPNSVVTFQPGSRYRLDGALTPAMSGRTYADFEYNNGGTFTGTGGSVFTVDSLIVSQGTLNVNVTAGSVIRGSIHVKAGGTLNMTPATGTPSFSFAGTGPQEIDVQGTFNPASNTVLNVNNANGVNLITNLSLAGGLSFTSGNVNTGARTLTLSATSAVTGAAQGAGWVNGNLVKNFAAGAFSGTLPVGDATRYAPIDVNGSGAGAGFALNASTTGSEHPNFASTGLDASRSVNRFWTMSSTNGTGAAWQATLNFQPSDLDGTADPSSFLARVWNGSAWTAVAPGASTATSLVLTGLSATTPGTQFVTLGGMVAQGIVGAKLYNGDYKLKDTHEALAVAVNTGYFTTAGLSLFAPPKAVDERRGFSSIKAHRWLAMLHMSGMILTNVLADGLHGDPRLRSLHRAAAYTAFGAYAASIIVIKF